MSTVSTECVEGVSRGCRLTLVSRCRDPDNIMTIEPRAALAATCKAVARAPSNGIPLSATAVPFFPSAWGERLD